MAIDQIELVRRLLGTATQLFLDDADPLSVHCLASSAIEHAEHIAETYSDRSFKSHVMGTFPDMTKIDFKRLRNRHWKVIKHSHDLSGKPFEVTKELDDFDDAANDAVLFAGWYDFMKCGQPIPIAAQVFQLWFFRMYPKSLNQSKEFEYQYFSQLDSLERHEQKRRLRAAIKKESFSDELLNHPMTDSRPLILPLF
ncbi:hypothetical protein [Albidovulum sediminis]|uniref:Uncharacterized protein n=1 Tax=Albidovulum sediminis TaxID=3066345 RepID=A0ABT2NM61_9RHOB|nr:hypothetical protein [Defluviimonas sediminis]MCT8329996.1 hypothetical protein [Defluviimonas sediminis]